MGHFIPSIIVNIIIILATEIYARRFYNKTTCTTFYFDKMSLGS